MGKQTGSYMPSLKTLPAADVLVLNDKGDPIRAIQAGRDGFVRPLRLPGTPSGHELLVVARRGTKSFSKVMTSIGSPPSAPVNFKGS